MTVTTYTVTIQCTSATVSALQAEGSALIGFSAVQGTDASALPVVWLSTTGYSTTTNIVWSTTYEAYTSSTAIKAGTLIEVGSAQAIVVGQVANVGGGGLITVANGGTAGYVTIANTTNDPYTCGIEQMVNNVFAPLCAYPLYGNNTQTIVPLPQIVLMFTTAPLAVGEAWSDDIPAPQVRLSASLDATGPAFWIDMSGQTTATVSYDVNDGWSAAGAPSWGQTISASLIVPTVIQPTPPPTLFSAHKEARHK
jgi:hypothetical protein